MDYDYYYEPKMKTSRNDDVQILNRCTFGNENKFKEELIAFLEDKIKERMDTIKINQRDNIEEIGSALTRRLAELNAFQEVLDFVNKGGKDE